MHLALSYPIIAASTDISSSLGYHVSLYHADFINITVVWSFAIFADISLSGRMAECLRLQAAPPETEGIYCYCTWVSFTAHIFLFVWIESFYKQIHRNNSQHFLDLVFHLLVAAITEYSEFVVCLGVLQSRK